MLVKVEATVAAYPYIEFPSLQDRQNELFTFCARHGKPQVLRPSQDEDDRSDTLLGKTHEGIYVGVSGSGGREASGGDVDGRDFPPPVVAQAAHERTEC